MSGTFAIDLIALLAAGWSVYRALVTTITKCLVWAQTVSGFTVAQTAACHIWPRSTTSEWSGHYDRRNQRRCNKQRHCDASAIPGWTMGHYAVADLALRASRAPSRPSFTDRAACVVLRRQTWR